MKREDIEALVHEQRSFFYTNETLDVKYRIQALEKLRKCIIKHESEIADALKRDLGKSGTESYMCETGLVLDEIRYMIKHLPGFVRDRKVRTPVAQFCAKSYQKASPYGVVLVMSPWNYPLLLALEPLVDAIAAGNTVIIKPSAYSPYTQRVVSTIIEECFDSRYVAVVTGGREENISLLETHFDYIFFTGSKTVGKEVMRHAAEHLTPVTLELGGKSPCIVDKSADIRLSVKRIVFGKFLNCGQTCVAPDYIYCDKEIKEQLLKELTKQIQKQFGRHPLSGKNYGKIINRKHFDRIIGLIDKEKVVTGGKYDKDTLQIEPTVMDNVTFDDKIMQEEIFGPVLPVIVYDDLQEVVGRVNSREHPLALYIFSRDQKSAEKVLSECGFGGGCINDTMIHLATSEMPFGGFGESGMGSYHGKAGFDTFTHYKSIVDKKLWIDLPMRYQPYKKINKKLIRMFLK